MCRGRDDPSTFFKVSSHLITSKKKNMKNTNPQKHGYKQYDLVELLSFGGLRYLFLFVLGLIKETNEIKSS